MTNIEKFMDQVKQRRFDTYETLALLMYTNRAIWMSWGVTVIQHREKEGLSIWVNGHHHVGWVVIILGWNDTYTYYLVSQDGTPKKRVDEVYFDELVQRIDEDIEYISEYGDR